MQQTGLANGLGFEERLGLLVDREMTERDNRAVETRLKLARLRQNVTFEQIDEAGLPISDRWVYRPFR